MNSNVRKIYVPEIKDIIDTTHFDKGGFLFFLLFAFLFYLPVIYGQSFYADDVARIYTGESGWSGLGRILATAAAYFYSLNSSMIIDASPLPWIMSIFILSICSSLVYIKIKPVCEDHAKFLALIFLFNPFFIQNLLYRFDNLGMTLALFFTVLAFSLKNNYFSYFLKVIFLVIALNLYQPFSNMFIGLLAIEAFLVADKKKSTKYFFAVIGISFSCFFLANVIYKLEVNIIDIILQHFIGRESLLPEGRSALLPITFSSVPYIVNNYITALFPFYEFWFGFSPYILGIVPFVIFSLIKLSINKGASIIITVIICTIIIIISTLGGMAILKNQFITARILTYFPIVMMFIVCILMDAYKCFRWLIIIPVFACFVFSYRVGNMHQIQTSYEKPIFSQATIDMSAIPKIETFYSIGHVPFSNHVKNLRNSTPFNGFLKRNSWLTSGALREYSGDLVEFEWEEDYRNTIDRYNDIKYTLSQVHDRSPFYKIYTKGIEGWIVWADDVYRK